LDFGLIIYALNLASIYALMAIGVSILWSSVGLLNMAHGATFAVSGYGAWLITGFMKPIIIASFGKTAFASFLMASTLVGSCVNLGCYLWRNNLFISLFTNT
jgi:branched-chain amino acid transport system permease protein